MMNPSPIKTVTRLLLLLLLALVGTDRVRAAGEAAAGSLPVPAKQKFQLGPWEQNIGYARRCGSGTCSLHLGFNRRR